MQSFMKAGFLLVSVFLLSSEAPRKTSSDFLMQSYSSGLKRQLAVNPAEYRAGQYRARYEVCGPDHDCVNATAGEAVRRKGIINDPKAGEAKRKFPFMSIPAFQ